MATVSPTVLVEQLYLTDLLRDPGASEVNYWTTALNGDLAIAAVVGDFVNAPESQDFVVPIVELYEDLLGRAPDAGGLSVWVNALRGGTSLQQIAEDFLGSAEFLSHNYTATTYVTSLYENMLGRAPDAGGLAGWVGYLNANGDSISAEATVYTDFLGSAEYQADFNGTNAAAPQDDWDAAINAYLTNAGVANVLAAESAGQTVAPSYASTVAGLPGQGSGTQVGTSLTAATDTIVLGTSVVDLDLTGISENVIIDPVITMDANEQAGPTTLLPGDIITGNGTSTTLEVVLQSSEALSTNVGVDYQDWAALSGIPDVVLQSETGVGSSSSSSSSVINDWDAAFPGVTNYTYQNSDGSLKIYNLPSTAITFNITNVGTNPDYDAPTLLLVFQDAALSATSANSVSITLNASGLEPYDGVSIELFDTFRLNLGVNDLNLTLVGDNAVYQLSSEDSAFSSTLDALTITGAGNLFVYEQIVADTRTNLITVTLPGATGDVTLNFGSECYDSNVVNLTGGAGGLDTFILGDPDYVSPFGNFTHDVITAQTGGATVRVAIDLSSSDGPFIVPLAFKSANFQQLEVHAVGSNAVVDLDGYQLQLFAIDGDCSPYGVTLNQASSALTTLELDAHGINDINTSSSGGEFGCITINGDGTLNSLLVVVSPDPYEDENISVQELSTPGVVTLTIDNNAALAAGYETSFCDLVDAALKTLNLSTTSPLLVTIDYTDTSLTTINVGSVGLGQQIVICDNVVFTPLLTINNINGLGYQGELTDGPNAVFEQLNATNLGFFSTATLTNIQDLVIDATAPPGPSGGAFNINVSGSPLSVVELVNGQESSEYTSETVGPWTIVPFVGVDLALASTTVLRLGDTLSLGDGLIQAAGLEYFDDAFDSPGGLPGSHPLGFPGNYVTVTFPNGTPASFTVELANTGYGCFAPGTLNVTVPVLDLTVTNSYDQQLLLTGAVAQTLNISGGFPSALPGSGSTEVYNGIVDLMAAGYLGCWASVSTLLPLNAATTMINASTSYDSVWVDVANAVSAVTFISGLGGQDWFIGSGSDGGPGFVDQVTINNFTAACPVDCFGSLGIPGSGTTVWGGPAGADVVLDVISNTNSPTGTPVLVTDVTAHGVLTNIDNLTINLGAGAPQLTFEDPIDLGGSITANGGVLADSGAHNLLTTLTVNGFAGSLFTVLDSCICTGLDSNVFNGGIDPGAVIIGNFAFGGTDFTSFNAGGDAGATIIVDAPDAWTSAVTFIGGSGTAVDSQCGAPVTVGSTLVTLLDAAGGGVYGTTNAAQFANWQTLVIDSFAISALTSSNIVNLPFAAGALQTVVVTGTAPLTLADLPTGVAIQLGDPINGLPSGQLADTAWYSVSDTPPTGSGSSETGCGGNQLNVTVVNSAGAAVTGATVTVIVDDTISCDSNSSSGGGGDPPATLNILNAGTVNIVAPNADLQSILLTGTPATTINISGGDNNLGAGLDLMGLTSGLMSPLNPATLVVNALTGPNGVYWGSIAVDLQDASAAVTVFGGFGGGNAIIGSTHSGDTYTDPNFTDDTAIQAGAGSTENLYVNFNTNDSGWAAITDYNLTNELAYYTGLASNTGGESFLNFIIASEAQLQFYGCGISDLDLNTLIDVTVTGGDNSGDSVFSVTGIACAGALSGTLGDPDAITGAFGGADFVSFNAGGFDGKISVIVANDSLLAGHSYTGSAEQSSLVPTILFNTLDHFGGGVYGGTFHNITDLVIDNFQIAGTTDNDGVLANMFNAAGFTPGNNDGTLVLTGTEFCFGLQNNPNPALDGTAPIDVFNVSTPIQLGYDGVGDLGITDQAFSEAIVANVTLTTAGPLTVILEDTANECLPGPVTYSVLGVTDLGGTNDTNIGDFSDFTNPGLLDATNATTVALVINDGNDQSVLLSKGSETAITVTGDPPGPFLPNDNQILNLTGVNPPVPTPNNTGAASGTPLTSSVTSLNASAFAGSVWANFAKASSAVTVIGGFGDSNILLGSAFADTFTILNFDDNTVIAGGAKGSTDNLTVLPGDEDVLNNLPKGKVSITETNLTNVTQENYTLGNDVTLAFNGSADLSDHLLTTVTVIGGDAPSVSEAGSFFVVNNPGDNSSGSFLGDTGAFKTFNAATFAGVTQVVAADNSLLAGQSYTGGAGGNGSGADANDFVITLDDGKTHSGLLLDWQNVLFLTEATSPASTTTVNVAGDTVANYIIDGNGNIIVDNVSPSSAVILGGLVTFQDPTTYGGAFTGNATVNLSGPGTLMITLGDSEGGSLSSNGDAGTVTITVPANAPAVQSVNLYGVQATTVNVVGGATGDTVDFGHGTNLGQQTLSPYTSVFNAGGFKGNVEVSAANFASGGATGVTITGGQATGNVLLGSNYDDVINDPNFSQASYLNGDPNTPIVNKSSEIANLTVQTTETITHQNLFGFTTENFLIAPSQSDPLDSQITLPITFIDDHSGNLSAQPPLGNVELSTVTVSGGEAGSYFIWTEDQSEPLYVTDFDAQGGPNGPFLGSVQIILPGGEANILFGIPAGTGGGLINGNTFNGGLGDNNVLVEQATDLPGTDNPTLSYYDAHVSYFQTVMFVTEEHGNVVDPADTGTNIRFMGLNAIGFAAGGPGGVQVIDVANANDTSGLANVAIINLDNQAGGITPTAIGLGDVVVNDIVTDPNAFANEPYQFYPTGTNATDAFYGGQYLLVNVANPTTAGDQPVSLTVDLNNEGYSDATAHAVPFTLDLGANGSTGTDPDGSAAVTLLTNGVDNFTFNAPTNDLAILPATTALLDFDLAIGYDANAPASGGSITLTGGQAGGVVAFDHQYDSQDNIQSGIPSNITTINASGLASDFVMAGDARTGTPSALTFTHGSGWDTVELANSGDNLSGNPASFTHNWLLVNANDLNGASGPFDFNLGAANEVVSWPGTSAVPTVTGFGEIDLSLISNGNLFGAAYAAEVTTADAGDTIITSHYSDMINLTDGSAATGADNVAFSSNVFNPYAYSTLSADTGIAFNSSSSTSYTEINGFDLSRGDTLGLSTTFANTLTNGVTGAQAMLGVAENGTLNLTAGTNNVFDLGTSGTASPAAHPATEGALQSVTSILSYLHNFTINTGGSTDTFVVAIEDTAKDAVGVYEVTANESSAAFGTNTADSVKMLGLASLSSSGTYDLVHNYHSPISSAPMIA